MVYSRSYGRLAQRESAAFTRQRSLVRSQHRPLSKSAILQGDPLCKNLFSERYSTLCSNRDTLQVEHSHPVLFYRDTYHELVVHTSTCSTPVRSIEACPLPPPCRRGSSGDRGSKAPALRRQKGSDLWTPGAPVHRGPPPG